MNHWKKPLSGLLTLIMMITILAGSAIAEPRGTLDLTFEMLDDYTLEIVGLPDDLTNPVADLYTSERVGTKKVIVYLAEEAPIVDGAMELNMGEPLVFETEYTIEIYSKDSDEYYRTTFVLSEQEEIPDVAQFVDVNYPSWYSSSLDYCVAKGYVSGIGGNRFGPWLTVTRAQVAQILYALEGKPEVLNSGIFPDVPQGRWFSDAINWAADNGVMSGYTTGYFLPNAEITRQQFMATVYKYAKLKQYDITRSGDITVFQDANDVTAYAIPAMQWATGHHVINGTTEHKLLPKSATNRAEMVVILASFDRNIAKADSKE